MKTLTDTFLEHIYNIPGGEKVKLCIQCGTCSGSCPTSKYMDYTPRQIIESLRAGLLDRVINSNTVWFCTSCYYCTVRCPSGIKFTDIMYELKRLGIQYNLFPKEVRAPFISRKFVNIVNRYGRLNEVMLILFAFPFKMLRMAPMGTRLFLKGRLKLFPDRIKGTSDLRRLEEWLSKKEAG